MNDHDLRRKANLLAAHVGCDPRTALKFLHHEKITRSIELALERAASQLDVQRGPKPSAESA